MNRSPVEQIYTASDFSIPNKNSHRPLLQQVLPKYRKQIFQKKFDSYQIDLTLKVKEKYRNFGEEDFIKKLKHNSTKQIDRKSIKAIDKYLHELNKEKQQPMGYLHRTSSMKGLGKLQEILLTQNEENSLSPILNLNKSSSISIIPSVLKAKSQQVINPKNNATNFTNNQRVKLSENEQSFQNSEEETIRESAKFRSNESLGNKNNSVGRLKNTLNMISFRNNFQPSQSVSSSSKNQKQSSKQQRTLKHEQQEGNLMAQVSQNNFYHKFSSPDSSSPSIYNKFSKERPTVDTQHKIKDPSQQSRVNTRNLRNNSLEKELKILKQKTQEQQEIIQLQEVMIEKLNLQLDKVLKMLYEKQEKNIKNLEMEKIDDNESEIFSKQIFQNKAEEQQKCSKLSLQLTKEMRHSSIEWESNFNKLKSYLASMSFDSEQQDADQQFIPRDNINIIQEEQDRFRVNQSSQQQEGYVSMNYFYHHPSNESYSSAVKQSKQRQPSELSNLLYSISTHPDRRELTYLGGTQLDFQLVEDQLSHEENERD